MTAAVPPGNRFVGKAGDRPEISRSSQSAGAGGRARRRRDPHAKTGRTAATKSTSRKPAIAISGITFFPGDEFPNLDEQRFVGGMRQGKVPCSGHLERIDFNAKWEEHRESMLRELQNRIRDAQQGPDGYPTC